MAIANQILKELAGVEDMLFGQGTVNQTRAGVVAAITKLNATHLPYTGDVATGDLVSVYSQLLALTNGSAPRGNTTLTVTGGTVNLTEAQFNNSSYDISGALTSDCTIVIPDNLPLIFIVDNLTTGAFTLTIKHATTAGQVVNQGDRTLLYTTGTVVESVAQSAVINAANIVNTPAGSIAATDVQAAINELATEKLDVSAAVANFVGAVVASAASIVPTGYLECDGSAVSRTTYSALFTAIGTVYGIGDGTTTFNLPDLRGEFIRGWDNGRGIDAARGFGTAQGDLFATHTHVYDHSISNAYTGSVALGQTAGLGGAGGVTAATGGTETRPRNIAMMYVIKI